MWALDHPVVVLAAIIRALHDALAQGSNGVIWVPSVLEVLVQNDMEQLVKGTELLRHVSAHHSAEGPNTSVRVRNHRLALELVPRADNTVRVPLQALNGLPHLVALGLRRHSHFDPAFHENDGKPHDVVDRAADHPVLALSPSIWATSRCSSLCALRASRIDQLLHVVIAHELKLLLSPQADPHVAIPSPILIRIRDELLEFVRRERAADLEAMAIVGLCQVSELRRYSLPVYQHPLLPPSETNLVHSSAWYLLVAPIEQPPTFFSFVVRTLYVDHLRSLIDSRVDSNLSVLVQAQEECLESCVA
mmetsp:Transcript_5849/g.12766  ORF Transcript_5849/g.12766 Transcript_5849/m.12766 type:complete len:305 (+) Transcript_5849:247-1161(+)